MFFAALEAFNRSTHTDALREMEPVVVPDEQPVISLRFGLGLLALSLAMIGVHWVWAVRL